MLINGRIDIESLIHVIYQVHNEWLIQNWSEHCEKWSDERKALYDEDIILGMFKEGNEELQNTLSLDVTDEVLCAEIMIDLQRKSKDYYAVKDRSEMDDFLYKRAEEQKNSLMKINIDAWIERYYYWLPEELTSSSQKRVFLYVYYVFNNLKEEKANLYNGDITGILSLYDDIFRKNSQLRKYGLVPLDKDRELMVIDPPRIYDKSIDTTIFIKGVPKELLITINDLLSNDIIRDVSLRVSDYPIIEGKTEFQELSEALERGKIFEMSDLGQQVISKFYSADYENCLWIIIDPDEMIFEELHQELDEYNDCIVTQMVHLKYLFEGTQYIITHLDHEYIFYSADEYIERLGNPRKKGEAAKRIKSFKIDNSCIPFDLKIPFRNITEEGELMEEKRELFLLYVLESFFVHKDLIREYFSSVCVNVEK